MMCYLCSVDDDVPTEVYAHGAAEAAIKYVEQYNARAVEFPESREVLVVYPPNKRETYIVRVEAIPTYSAKKKP